MTNTIANAPAPTPAPNVVQSSGYVGVPSVPLARIFYAYADHLSLISGDRVLVDAGANKNLQVGAQLTVFRPTTAVPHPTTKQALGPMVATVGTAIVVSVQPTTALLQITKAFEEIMVGDQVKPFVPPPPLDTPETLSARPRAITGLVVATKDQKFVVATGDIVYLDRGEQHGVVLGDRFDVLQEHRGVRHLTSSQWLSVPPQIFATLTVMDVRSRTSTALVTTSQREFSVGTVVTLSSSPEQEQLAALPAVGEELTTRAETGLAQLSPCLDAARQAIHAAEKAGGQTTEVTAAQTALARAEILFKNAQQALARGDYEQAISLLERAQADCLNAQALGLPGTPTARPEAYRVQRGDTLWGISARPMIYANPLMWPLIYQANRQQLRDPDVLFPRQLLAIPRDFSNEQAQLAIQRARKRGRWRLHDGPDLSVLEGIQR
jgi:hypothetical protein